MSAAQLVFPPPELQATWWAARTAKLSARCTAQVEETPALIERMGMNPARAKTIAMRLHALELLSDCELSQLFAANPDWRHA